ncbi:FAD/NAD(P)-binding domain-containing protein [Thozetella sp. PMI_491]|nr:FAD/NAD(P)-binding domain-containing protein [Thozetella sp. PMI_491]
MPLEIITIGGSLAGMMASIPLRRLGHNVRIMERASTSLLHDQGAGIVAGGDIQMFLDQYDRTQTPIAVKSHQRLYFADKSGDHIRRENTPQRMSSWDLIYHICRANFDRYKSDYIKEYDLSVDVPGEGTASYEYGRLVTISYKSTYATADFVVIADGASSTVRKALCPSAPERTYAGYVAFRGTVPESELSPEAKAVFVGRFPFYQTSGSQILAYAVPGRLGILETGQRLINWVWYVNVPGSSDQFRIIMTDKFGITHRWTLPTGGHMSTDVWETQKKAAEENLPPQFAELVLKTTAPFVQAITDLAPPNDDKCWVLGGRGVIVGDALAGFRPHTAASTAQAAMHAMLLGRVFGGEMERDHYERTVIQFAKHTQRSGVLMGNRSQFGQEPPRVN